MKKASLIATALVLSSGGSQVHAQALKGSDTLEGVTSAILASCPNVSPLTYSGTGSTNGENALALNLSSPSATNFQQVAPMSRPIRCTRLAPGGDLQSVNGTAQGYFLGMDGLSIFRSECTFTSGACEAYSNAESAGLPDGYVWSGGLDAALPPPAVGGRYNIAADKLRVLYFGRDHNNVTNCNSPLRQALVNSWDELFEGAQSESCTEIERRHLIPTASGAQVAALLAEDVDPRPNFHEATRRFQASLLREALARESWNVAATARTLGLTRAHLYNLLAAYEIARPAATSSESV